MSVNCDSWFFFLLFFFLNIPVEVCVSWIGIYNLSWLPACVVRTGVFNIYPSDPEDSGSMTIYSVMAHLANHSHFSKH